MFPLAVLYKVVPKWFILPRIVFVQPGLGFSSSHPHGDGSCWRWGMVEHVGISWRIAFSLQLLGAAPSCAVLLRGHVPEEPTCEAKDQDGVCTHNMVLSSLPPNTRCKWLPTKICLLWWDSWRKAAENEACGFVELERKQSLLILASVLFQLWRERRPYLLVTKEILTRLQRMPAKPVQIKVCTGQSCEN